jgi:hypothetical protein
MRQTEETTEQFRVKESETVVLQTSLPAVRSEGLAPPQSVALRQQEFFAFAEEPKPNFYNWDTYIGETTLETSKSERHRRQYSLFATNDELFVIARRQSRLRRHRARQLFVERMIQQTARAARPCQDPSIKNIAPEFATRAV